MHPPTAELLAALAAVDPGLADDLLDPWGGAGVPAGEVGPPLSVLVDAGLVTVANGRARARRWVATRRGRPYLMSLAERGAPEVWGQDVWPETDAMIARAVGTRGSVLDLGTGCGVVGIEAALAGARVTATELHGIL